MTPASLITITLAFATPQFTAPAGMTSFDADALAEASTISLKSEDGQQRLAAIAAVLDQELSRGDRVRLGRKVLSKRRVSIAKGSFPGGADALVTINVDLRMKDPEAPQKFISGAFTLTATGELGAVIVPPAMRTERVDLASIGDVDADGTSDLLFTQGTEAASVMHLVTWAGTAPADHIVTPAEA